jgi:hypothetical protein
MAYRAPRFSYLHPLRDLGPGAITLNGGTADTEHGVEFMCDDRDSTFFQYSGAVDTPFIEIDLGTEYYNNAVDRIILGGAGSVATFYVQEDDNDSFASPTDLLGSVGSPVTPNGGTNLVKAVELETAQSERYIRLAIVGNGQWAISQLVFTNLETLTVGPNITDSPDGYRANVTRLEQPSGSSPTVQNGPQQRIITYNYENPLTGTDLTKMEALIADVGMTRPFWLDPHSFSATPDDDDRPLFVKFNDMPRTRNSILVPMVGEESKVFSLDLIEALD